MFLRQLDLTTALRPSLLPDETLLFVQDAVGLYEGKYKLPNYQNGHAYLTSHRACYVDNEEPRKYSVALELKDVEKADLYAGFLKSSPKITLYPKPSKRASLTPRGLPQSVGGSARLSPTSTPPTRHGSPARSFAPSPAPPVTTATWICPICSFSNPVPTNFDPATANAHTPLPPCLACGIKPPLIHVVKAAIVGISKRQAPVVAPVPQRNFDPFASLSQTQSADARSFICPRCTFENHPSLIACEMCGASLVSAPDKRLDLSDAASRRVESPGPSLDDQSVERDSIECVKFSFRAGGEKIFYERLRGALVQRKWLLYSAPPVPKPNNPPGTPQNGRSPFTASSSSPVPDKGIGIAGLERRGAELRKNNEVVIGTAFEDLEALMTSAKEVIALAEQFASQASIGSDGNASEANALISQSASALGLVTTKDMLGSGSGSESLYVSELSRNLAEFLTDDSKGILKREGGIMSLVDLWAVFNRARGGVELVSPADFKKAAQMWDKLKLPVRLRRFKSGLLVVQGRDRTDEKTIASLLAWLKELHFDIPKEEVTWDWTRFGRGVTAQETAQRFGWSVGVASEELEMAEEKGALCREQDFDGLKFWENWLVELPAETLDKQQ
ncbi:Vacuolar protein-sorting-associated protein 36 [Coniosporium apollinis]|uniref:Vacuolar protein-sorting-associated protein 36 n=1 Tax=Coniosporium apollinis TaxID=61459 RepID=A0ABQ9PA96_9PEZI|nr:Vacuolar protein-sorting-associated protein 36 [Coniosporium apollinis]